MLNHLNNLYFAEITKTKLDEDYATTISYDDIVDAIGKLNLENEATLYILGGNDMRKALRKDDNFVAARQGEIIFTGHIGFLAGIPVIISKKVETGIVYVADKSAVQFIVKKDSEVAQERDEDKRTTDYFFRRTGLVALVDSTKVCRLGGAESKTPTVAALINAAEAVTGVCSDKATLIDVYVNGVIVATGACKTDDSDAYSIAVPAVKTGDKIKIYSRADGKAGVFSAETTVTAN